jgi:hypothetical protein
LQRASGTEEDLLVDEVSDQVVRAERRRRSHKAHPVAHRRVRCADVAQLASVGNNLYSIITLLSSQNDYSVYYLPATLGRFRSQWVARRCVLLSGDQISFRSE